VEKSGFQTAGRGLDERFSDMFLLPQEIRSFSLSGNLVSASNYAFSIYRFKQHYFWSAGYIASGLVSPITAVILVEKDDGFVFWGCFTCLG